MPFLSKRKQLILDHESREKLNILSRSRTEPARRVERSKILLFFADKKSVNAIAKALHTYREKITRCIQKALDMGIDAALSDLPGRGAHAEISLEAKTWLTQIACQKPKNFGYSYELWTNDLLAKHARKFGPQG